jgi:hypothetical protein
MSYVAFEEIEDEGAGYAFALEGGRVMFVVGQEFYRRGRFPSLDFSLVYVLDNDDRRLAVMIAKRGAWSAASKIISAEEKLKLQLPTHLETLGGPIDTLAEQMIPQLP